MKANTLLLKRHGKIRPFWLKPEAQKPTLPKLSNTSTQVSGNYWRVSGDVIVYNELLAYKNTSY